MKIIFALAVLLAPTAASAAQCGGSLSVWGALSGRYHESRQAVGLAAGGVVVEVWASKEGTWTVLATSPDGQSCVVAAGQAYEPIMAPFPAEGEPG